MSAGGDTCPEGLGSVFVPRSWSVLFFSAVAVSRQLFCCRLTGRLAINVAALDRPLAAGQFPSQVGKFRRLYAMVWMSSAVSTGFLTAAATIKRRCSSLPSI